MKRVGHGYRNFANYRLRLLLHRGLDWHTPAVTPIRGGYHAWLRRARLVLGLFVAAGVVGAVEGE